MSEMLPAYYSAAQLYREAGFSERLYIQSWEWFLGFDDGEGCKIFLGLGALDDDSKNWCEVETY